MSELAAWDSFYVIVGSAAGALIGLQFVVMTLIAERPALRAAEAGAAFATPTVIHFGAALLLSALLRVPWQSIIGAAALWGLMGFVGVAYAVIVACACEPKPYTNQSWRTGYFMLFSLWRRTQCSRYLHSRLLITRARPCLALERRRCCCFSSAFTTPGTASLTMYLAATEIQNTNQS
jgi:hypothetical protein